MSSKRAMPATGYPEGSGNFRVTQRRSHLVSVLSRGELEELGELLVLISDAPHFATDENIERAQALLNKAAGTSYRCTR